jgi:hypothetical protein
VHHLPPIYWICTNGQEEKELAKFGDGVDELFGINEGTNGLLLGGRALIKGSHVANSAAGRNAINLVDDAASAEGGINKSQNMRNAAYSPETVDVAQSTS